MAVSVEERTRECVINPMYDCQPCGAQYATIGIKDCIPLVHGGQGCCTFVRLLFAQHFKENFDIATSSLHESAAVLGGMKNVEVAVETIVRRYPDVRLIPVITTCSTETIGDDVDGVSLKMNRIIKKEFPDRHIQVVPIHTPSYSGSMVTGYDNAMLSLMQHMAKKGAPSGKLNIFTGWVNPGDVKEIKFILKEMGVDANVLMDTTTFDSPTMPGKDAFAYGNTKIEEIEDAANAVGTIALSRYEGGAAAQYLEDEFSVPSVVGPTPIGIENTDTFLANISKLTGKKIPDSLAEERGRALDAIEDLVHMWFANKKVAIFGNPDMVFGLAQFCMEMELEPVFLLLGDDNKKYAKDPRLELLRKKADYDIDVVWDSDLYELEERIKSGALKVDLMMGNSKGRFVSIDSKVPMLRVGFPLFDRAGLWKFPMIGYKGAEFLAESLANVLFTDMEYKKNREWTINVW